VFQVRVVVYPKNTPNKFGVFFIQDCLSKYRPHYSIPKYLIRFFGYKAVWWSMTSANSNCPRRYFLAGLLVGSSCSPSPHPRGFPQMKQVFSQLYIHWPQHCHRTFATVLSGFWAASIAWACSRATRSFSATIWRVTGIWWRRCFLRPLGRRLPTHVAGGSVCSRILRRAPQVLILVPHFVRGNALFKIITLFF